MGFCCKAHIVWVHELHGWVTLDALVTK